MPFKVSDVERHIKGLDDNQKKVWVRVANKELKEGTSEGSAIRQASAVAKRAKEFKHETTHNIKGVEIFAVGTWNGDEYTVEDLDDMIGAFGQVGFEPPLKLGHNAEQEEKIMKDGQPALGWVEHIFREGDKLLADFKEMPKSVFEALDARRYKTVSSEIWFNLTRDDKKFRRVLKAVALLGADIPGAILNPIEFIGDKDVHIINFDNEGFEKKAPESTKTEEERQMDEKKEQELKDKVEKLEQENKGLSEDNKDLTESKGKMETKLSEQEKEAKNREVANFINEMKSEGRILPAHEKEVTALLSSASDEKVIKFSTEEGKSEELSQLDMAKRIFKKMPNLVQFEELAGGSGDEPVEKHDFADKKEAGDEVDKRAKLHMDKNSDVKYEDAVTFVLSKDAKLKEAYMERE